MSKNTPSREILEQRYKGYFFSENQLFLLSKDAVAKKLCIQFVEEKVKSKKIKQLKGSVACKGLVRGYVRILMGHDQIPLLKHGEILVSPMTIPDFLPAMKKAAAFEYFQFETHTRFVLSRHIRNWGSFFVTSRDVNKKSPRKCTIKKTKDSKY